jgi:glycosyltransferase involved in cell wall biosynthesis
MRSVLARSESATPKSHSLNGSPRAVAAEVIVPLYMERTVIHKVHGALVAFVNRHPHWRVRFVDDGSTDGTPHLLATLLAINDEVGRLTLDVLPTNRGKADAVAHGIMRSEAAHIFYMDGDLAYDPELLIALDVALRDADMAIGSRALDASSRAPGFMRRTMGDSYNAMVRGVLGLSFRDTQAGIKGFRRAAAQQLFSARRARDFGFDAELLFLAKRLGLRVAEVPVTVSPDHAALGSNVRLIRDPLKMFAGMMTIRARATFGRYGRVK